MKSIRIALIAIAGLMLLPPQEASAQFRRYANQIGRIVNQVQRNQRHEQHEQHNNHQQDNNHQRHYQQPVHHNNHQPAHDSHTSQVIGQEQGYHVDHHDHIVRDAHGHIIGRYHHDVIHKDASYVVPHQGQHNDSYHMHNGQYYYTPQTALKTQVVIQPVAVRYGSFLHVDDLASRLEELTNEFLLDLHYNYRHNHGFAETYAEGYELLQVAKYIHDAEHAQDRNAIRARIGGMDALFHHLQDDVRGWSRHHVRQIGQLGILSKMDMIEGTLHHLMNDIGVGQAAGAGGPEVAPPPIGFAPPPLTVAPAPPR